VKLDRQDSLGPRRMYERQYFAFIVLCRNCKRRDPDCPFQSCSCDTILTIRRACWGYTPDRQIPGNVLPRLEHLSTSLGRSISTGSPLVTWVRRGHEALPQRNDCCATPLAVIWFLRCVFAIVANKGIDATRLSHQIFPIVCAMCGRNENIRSDKPSCPYGPSTGRLFRL
jgi:hypothetical protein